MRIGYIPELDITEELKSEEFTWYQELIGQLRWAIEIGRVDILLKVSLLYQHLSLSRDGHLEQALHIMGYLKTHNKIRLMFDKGMLTFDDRMFKSYDWEDFYKNSKEHIPPNMPEARGLPVERAHSVPSSVP